MYNQPFPTNPMPWRTIGNARLGDHLLGESTVDLDSLGFCGETETVSCTLCGEVLELLEEWQSPEKVSELIAVFEFLGQIIEPMAKLKMSTLNLP